MTNTSTNRDDIRGAIFAAKKRKFKIISAFGTELEVRQPSLGDLLGLQELPDQQSRIAQSLISYCYVPGTKEKVFEDADKDVILDMPFDEDFIKLQEAITALTGVNIEETKGNLGATTDSTTS